mmetsp:Transcript_49239/g.122341  ORF Transcript_49239/g.122341 Transcript_49239/m.122341 type:complete len:99 (+) Transcript_49239:657-953(+)
MLQRASVPLAELGSVRARLSNMRQRAPPAGQPTMLVCRSPPLRRHSCEKQDDEPDILVLCGGMSEHKCYDVDHARMDDGAQLTGTPAPTSRYLLLTAL